jgi:hypothetical protein
MGPQPPTGLGPPFCKELKKDAALTCYILSFSWEDYKSLPSLSRKMLLYRDHMVSNHDSSLKILPLMNGIRPSLVWLNFTGMCRSERRRCDP